LAIRHIVSKSCSTCRAYHGWKEIEEDSSGPKNPGSGLKRQIDVSVVIDITRVDVVQALDEAKERFTRADAALKTFRFSYPAKSEEFEEWKHLRDAWEQRDEELQAAREDLRDFDRGKLTGSSE
jgi:homoaconitase/3-isopropylmalate dehydratase large subunit